MGSVVVLTGSMQYWGDRTLRDVLKLHAKNKITPVVSDESRIIRAGHNPHGDDFAMSMPLVVVLHTFFGCTFKEDKGPLRFDPELVYERDQNNCQYWHFNEFGKKYIYKCPSDDRTIDHIFPQWRGGEDSYTNCVCACKTCNIKRKGGLTPKEAGLKLIRQPREPQVRRGGWGVVNFNFNPKSMAHVAYKQYLDSIAA